MKKSTMKAALFQKLTKFSKADKKLRVILNASTEAVQCFCTSREQPCQEPICEGTYCLVGFKNDVDLVQTCATEAAKILNKCARKLNEWQEVCSCQEDHCNTFSFMRERLKAFDNDPQARKQVEGADTSNIVDSRAISRSTASRKRNVRKHHMIILLVVIPLGVGALAVFLIFINYHCKMC
uniref:Uncharacterized protein n=1 Tax=Romanomermis culicivorax TaxID=13658 RepID=A0A915HPQ7_ROMCU